MNRFFINFLVFSLMCNALFYRINENMDASLPKESTASRGYMTRYSMISPNTFRWTLLRSTNDELHVVSEGISINRSFRSLTPTPMRLKPISWSPADPFIEQVDIQRFNGAITFILDNYDESLGDISMANYPFIYNGRRIDFHDLILVLEKELKADLKNNGKFVRPIVLIVKFPVSSLYLDRVVKEITAYPSAGFAIRLYEQIPPTDDLFR